MKSPQGLIWDTPGRRQKFRRPMPVMTEADWQELDRLEAVEMADEPVFRLRLVEKREFQASQAEGC